MNEWKESLPEDLRAAPIVQEAKDLPGLVKQTLDFQRMLGSALRVPSEHASEEEKAAFIDKATKHGLLPREKFFEYVRPEKADGYTMATPPPDADALGLSQQHVDAWKAEAHAMGLSPAQFNALADSRIKAIRDAATDRAARFTAADAALKGEWGESFADRKAAALAAAKRFGGDELVNRLGENPDPAMIKALGAVGVLFKEQGLGDLTPRPRFAETPQEAAVKLAEIQGNKDHPFNLGRQRIGKAAHDAAMQEVMRLRAISMGLPEPKGDFMFAE